MNYSTIKKTAIAASLVAALGYAENAQAQAQVFGGRSQYRTWSIGLQGGITTPNVVIGGQNAFGQQVGYFQNKVGEYYGLTIRKQFSHLFGLEVEGNRGTIKTFNSSLAGFEAGSGVNGAGTARSAKTTVNWAGSLNGVFQLGTIDFLRRENAVNFYAKVGLGAMAFNPVQYGSNDFSGAEVYNNKGNWGQEIFGDREKVGDRDYRLGMYVPVGVGVKFKLSEVVALNLGYTMNFTDDGILYGPTAKSTNNQRFSNLYGGLEFTLGSRDKESLTFANPVANLYDELKDPSLRNEVEALKQRVSTLEAAVAILGTDSDGDGVSDRFDKCPNTPAGTVVDGSGCPIIFPEAVVVEKVTVQTFSPIQFEFDSSVLKTSSYAELDRLAKDLRATSAPVLLNGYASSEGSASYNVTLSQDRANAVKQYLVNAGVAASKISTKGYGDANPVASNATEAGRVLNRRVEIK